MNNKLKLESLRLLKDNLLEKSVKLTKSYSETDRLKIELSGLLFDLNRIQLDIEEVDNEIGKLSKDTWDDIPF